jgi:hypothetical protein
MFGVEADLQPHLTVDADQLRLVVLAGVVVEPHLHPSAVHPDVALAVDARDETLECVAHDLEEPRLHDREVTSVGTRRAPGTLEHGYRGTAASSCPLGDLAVRLRAWPLQDRCWRGPHDTVATAWRPFFQEP